MKREFPLTYEWLLKHKKTLLQRAAFKRYFRADRDPFWSLFNTGDYTLARWKVVWPEQAGELACAIVGGKRGNPIVPDHKVMLIDCATEEEAYYVAGVLNSSLFRYAVSSYAIEIQMNPHLLKNIRVPRFDGAATHLCIAAEARRLANDPTEATAPLHPELDQMCARLWGVDERGLKGVQKAYSELHQSPVTASSTTVATEEAEE
jgi:hypothetical protein